VAVAAHEERAHVARHQLAGGRERRHARMLARGLRADKSTNVKDGGADRR